MAKNLTTPGVYIEEKNAFPNSAVAVETAVPVFIGYTEKADYKGESLLMKPVRITSFAEYIERFGSGFKPKFSLSKLVTNPVSDVEKALEIKASENPENVIKIDGAQWLVSIKDNQTALFYNSIRIFYANGGGPCYILSIGIYGGNADLEIKTEDFANPEIFSRLEKEFEPTLVLMPDLIHNCAEAYPVYTMVLAHCEKVQSRFAIFDIARKTANGKSETDDVVQEFRDSIGVNALKYGAAYYPWLKTSIVSPSEVSLDNLDILGGAETFFPEPDAKPALKNYTSAHTEAEAAVEMAKRTIKELGDKATNVELKAEADANEKLAQIKNSFHKALWATSPTYVAILEIVRMHLNKLPPSGAMAGIYTMVDNTRGVWKAPANVSVSMVNAPLVNISHHSQETLNVDVIGGKSINVIRSFPGIGTLVWGGRTLDGNSLDWRYINVRRTLIMIEQSLKLAIRAYVFEPNDANTWVTVKSMICNFLTNLWKQGALAGAAPEQAFDVQIGLGATMTANDILEGKMLISVKVAVVRPNEFIVITFEQQLQQS